MAEEVVNVAVLEIDLTENLLDLLGLLPLGGLDLGDDSGARDQVSGTKDAVVFGFDFVEGVGEVFLFKEGVEKSSGSHLSF